MNDNHLEKLRCAGVACNNLFLYRDFCDKAGQLIQLRILVCCVYL